MDELSKIYLKQDCMKYGGSDRFSNVTRFFECGESVDVINIEALMGRGQTCIYSVCNRSSPPTRKYSKGTEMPSELIPQLGRGPERFKNLHC
jgi:hypothetical protein